jgi:thiosulfate sulfurtransferase
VSRPGEHAHAQRRRAPGGTGVHSRARVRSLLRRITLPVGLGCTALLFAGAALLADPPGAAPDAPYADRTRPTDTGAVVPEGAVDAIELAHWIRDAKPGLLVLDIRDAASFEAYHIPTARHVPVEKLAALVAEPGETLVLYADDASPAAARAAELRRRGYEQAYWLHAGLADWADRILEPTLRADAGEAERAAFREISDLARWFGGIPRTDAGAPAASSASPVSASARVKAIRRGC